jgi:hypothetical protein
MRRGAPEVRAHLVGICFMGLGPTLFDIVDYLKRYVGGFGAFDGSSLAYQRF